MTLRRLACALVALAAAAAALAEKSLLVSKTDMQLYVMDGRDTVAAYPVCLGRNLGQKTRAGDRKTPEGTFSICQIQDASAWTHDFHDGAGERRGAYGPWFFRLRTPMSRSIGIHGTCFPERMGTRDSEGCIRLRNEDLQQLRKVVFVGMKVVVTPDPK